MRSDYQRKYLSVLLIGYLLADICGRVMSFDVDITTTDTTNNNLPLQEGNVDPKEKAPASLRKLQYYEPEDSNTDKETPNMKKGSDSMFKVSALAIGDWGSTTFKEGSCCNRYRKNSGSEYARDFWSQKNLAKLFARSAEEMDPSPSCVINHGDNFYWNGVVPSDRDRRFKETFEDMYNFPSLEGIKWLGVTGNHDIAGSGLLCGDDPPKKCKDANDLVKCINRKFTLQSEYVSPNQNRWYMPSHYYSYSLKNEGVSVDIFNIDTNYADNHAAVQICCQCYGYASAEQQHQCSNVNRGQSLCVGGDTVMFDACMATLKEWWNESLTGIVKDLEKSTADFKIVNSHYSPIYHMGKSKMNQWFDILKKYNVEVFINGHTHGENHEISDWGTHFFQNGAGGGIQSEYGGRSPIKEVKHIWTANANAYGFFEIFASKDWIKLQFVTFDKNWVFSTDLSKVGVGGKYIGHCWLIPKGGGPGKAC